MTANIVRGLKVAMSQCENRLRLERSQTNPSLKRRNDCTTTALDSSLSQANMTRHAVSILRLRSFSRLLVCPEEVALSLSHVKVAKEEVQNASMHSAAFSCVSADAEQFSNPCYHIRTRDDALPCDLCRIYLHVDIIADG